MEKMWQGRKSKGGKLFLVFWDKSRPSTLDMQQLVGMSRAKFYEIYCCNVLFEYVKIDIKIHNI